MTRRCVACGTMNRIRCEGEKPGTCIYYTCGKCGRAKQPTVVPGNPDRDRIFEKVHGVIDLAHELGIRIPAP